MRIQLISDLHLETECFSPRPAPGADVLVLAGDVDREWHGLGAFRGWPVPVLFVPGNHEYDGRDLDEANDALMHRCDDLGFTWLHRRAIVLQAQNGRKVRFIGAVRWSDFDTFGPAGRERAMRSAAYFLRLMNARIGARPLDPEAMRAEGLRCRAWLEEALARAAPDETVVVVTHYAPSLRSADPRYGRQPSTASFCNADDDLLARADLWLHGHLHARSDYLVERPLRRPTRVVCQARGLARKGEDAGWDAALLIDVPGTGPDARDDATR